MKGFDIKNINLNEDTDNLKKVMYLEDLELSALKEQLEKDEISVLDKIRLKLKIYEKEEFLNAKKKISLNFKEKINRLKILMGIYKEFAHYYKYLINTSYYDKENLISINNKINLFKYTAEYEQLQDDISFLKKRKRNAVGKDKPIDLKKANEIFNENLKELKYYLELLKTKRKILSELQFENLSKKYDIEKKIFLLDNEIKAKEEFIKHYEYRKNIISFV